MRTQKSNYLELRRQIKESSVKARDRARSNQLGQGVLSENVESSYHPRSVMMGVTLCWINKTVKAQNFKFAFLLMKGLYRDSSRLDTEQLPKPRRSIGKIYVRNRNSITEEKPDPSTSLRKLNSLCLLLHYKVLAKFRGFFNLFPVENIKQLAIFEAFIRKKTARKTLKAWKQKYFKNSSRKKLACEKLTKCLSSKIRSVFEGFQVYQVSGFQCLNKIKIKPETAVASKTVMFQQFFSHSHTIEETPRFKKPTVKYQSKPIRALPITSRDSSPSKQLKNMKEINKAHVNTRKRIGQRTGITNLTENLKMLIIRRKRDCFTSIKQIMVQDGMVLLYCTFVKAQKRQMFESLKSYSNQIHVFRSLNAIFKDVSLQKSFLRIKDIYETERRANSMQKCYKRRYGKMLNGNLNTKNIRLRKFMAQSVLNKAYIRTIAGSFAIWFTMTRVKRIRQRRSSSSLSNYSKLHTRCCSPMSASIKKNHDYSSIYNNKHSITRYTETDKNNTRVLRSSLFKTDKYYNS